MSIPGLKRLLWVMNEILAASPDGITRDEISYKWAASIKNDLKESDIKERTFHRIKNDLMELFECKIVCNPTTKQYFIELPNYYNSDYQLSLLDILLKKEATSRKGTTINEILQMLTIGNDIPNDDMRAARDLSFALRHFPQQYANEFLDIANNGNIIGEDKSDKDEFYHNYVCIWNDQVFKRSRQWLSIGFYEDEIYFYVVTDESEPIERQRKAIQAELDEGIRSRGGYYWHKPSNKKLFSLKFDIKPNMDDVVKQAEILLTQLEKVTPKDEKYSD